MKVKHGYHGLWLCNLHKYILYPVSQRFCCKFEEQNRKIKDMPGIPDSNNIADITV